VTSVEENEEKVNTIQPSFHVFFSPSLRQSSTDTPNLEEKEHDKSV